MASGQTPMYENEFSAHAYLLSATQIKPLQMHAFAKISLIFHFPCAGFRAQLMLGYIHQVNAFSQTLWAEKLGRGSFLVIHCDNIPVIRYTLQRCMHAF